MNILEKFELGIISRTYQRIDSEYRVNIFLGYNDDGNMSLVITENGKDMLIKSSKIINVQLKRRADNKLALSFDLLDDTYKSLFLIFCKDIIETSEKVGNEMAISKALIRWRYWREMFGKNIKNILDKAQIQGLIGELIVLNDFILKNWDEVSAIECWMGPLLGHKDFEIKDTWYEVKSINENSILVTMSSLEQLESDSDGHLVIVRLEETNSVADSSINLNKMVISTMEKIKDPENLDAFRLKLDFLGYVYDEQYDNFNYNYKGKNSYIINSEFPRLRRSEINSSIGNVKYTIMLDGIIEFKEG